MRSLQWRMGRFARYSTENIGMLTQPKIAEP